MPTKQAMEYKKGPHLTTECQTFTSPLGQRIDLNSEPEQQEDEMIVAFFWSIVAYLRGRIQQTFLYLVENSLLIRVPTFFHTPGPLANWIPIVGSLPLFGHVPTHIVLTKIAEKYDRIYRLELGYTTFIVIHDIRLLQDLFILPHLCGRKMPVMMDVMEGLGIVHADGEIWRSQRSFVEQVMRDIGLPRSVNNNRFDVRASGAIDFFLREIVATEGEPIFIDEALCFTLTNIFFSILVGKTFERGDERLKSIIDSCHQSFRVTEPISCANFIPFLSKLPWNRKILRDIEARKVLCADYMGEIIEDHTQRLNPANPTDFVDAYLVQIRNREEYFTEIQLVAILGDLFTTSLEKTSTAIHWLILALVTFPDIQQRISQELRDVIKENVPTVDDRSRLPYLEATIREGHRFSPILPYGPVHTATRENFSANSTIPKDSTIVGLFWKFNRDPRHWRNPDQFDPNNHFSNDGELLDRPHMMPYSTGLRKCLGADVAEDEIFLVLARLLQKFTILPAEAPLPTMDESLGGVLRTPLPFKIRLVSTQ